MVFLKGETRLLGPPFSPHRSEVEGPSLCMLVCLLCLWGVLPLCPLSALSQPRYYMLADLWSYLVDLTKCAHSAHSLLI